jgi:ankyrin repeat protein
MRIQGQIECVRLLLASKARTDAQKTNSSVSNGGFMPLHFAAAKGHTEVCRLLLEAAADVQGGDRAVRTSNFQCLMSADLFVQFSYLNNIKLSAGN